jgi:hypothetical protein
MTEQQDGVRKTLQEFAGVCQENAAPVDMVIVCRRPDGTVGCFAPETDTVPQIGLLHLGIQMLTKHLLGG